MMYGVSLNKDGTTKILCQRLEHPDVPPDPARQPLPSWSRCQRASGSASVRAWRSSSPSCSSVSPSGSSSSDSGARKEAERLREEPEPAIPAPTIPTPAPEPRERLGTRVRTLLSRGGTEAWRRSTTSC